MSFSGLRLFTLFLSFSVALRVTAAPGFDWTSGPPRIHGFPVGTKVVWMAMVRERIDDQSHMTVLRGVQTIDASGKLEVDRIDRDFTRSVWLLAAVDGNSFVQGAAPEYPPAPAVIPVHAAKGGTSLTVHAQSVHLTWLAQGETWVFAGADGGARDADGVQNGIIVIPLASMSAFKGKATPPSVLSAGDRFLLIDPDENRVTFQAVSE